MSRTALVALTICLLVLAAGCDLFLPDLGGAPDPPAPSAPPPQPPPEPTLPDPPADTKPVELPDDTTPVELPGDPPRVVDLALSLPDGFHPAETTLDLAATFARPVSVNGGPPVIVLCNGVTAALAAGSGTATLVFRARFGPGDDAALLDLGPARAIDPRGATLRDAAGRDATLSLPDAFAGRRIAIDTTPPRPSLHPAATAEHAPAVAGWCDEPVTRVVVGAPGRTAEAVVEGLSFSLPPGALGPFAPGAHDLTVEAVDRAGNVGRTFQPGALVILDRAPTVQPLALALAEDTSLAFSLVGEDPDGDDLTYEIVTPPAHGTLTGAPPSLVYIPERDFSGRDSFLFRALSRGLPSAPVEALLTVTPVDDPPRIAPLPDVATDEDTTLGPLAVSATDVDTPASLLVFTAHAEDESLLPAAGVRLTGQGGARALFLTPAPDACGETTLTVRVSDGPATVSAAFRVTIRPVNDPPRIAPLPSRTADAANPGGEAALLLSDPDDPPESLAVTAAASDPALLAAPLSLSGSGANRTLAWLTAPGAVGATDILLTVSDGRLFATTVFTLHVDRPDTPPSLSPIDDLAIDEDTTAGPIAFTVGDAETAPGNLRIEAAADHPALIDGAGLRLGGAGADRTLTLAPRPDAFGETTVTLAVDDGHHRITTAFRLTVRPVDDPPSIALPESLEVDEDAPPTAVPFSLADPDTPLDALTLTATADDPALLPPDRILLSGDGSARALTLSPAPDASGSTRVIVAASDAASVTRATLTFVVRPVNDPPRLAPLPDLTGEEGTPFAPLPFPLSDPETPADALTLTLSLSGGPLGPEHVLLGGAGGTRTLTVIPPATGFGVTRVSLTLSDGSLAVTRTFTVTLRDVVPAPDPARVAYRAPVNAFRLDAALDGSSSNSNYLLLVRAERAGRRVEFVSRAPLPASGDLPLRSDLFTVRAGNPDDVDASSTADGAVTAALAAGTALAFALIGAESGVEGPLAPDGGVPAAPEPHLLSADAARGTITAAAAPGKPGETLRVHQAADPSGIGARFLDAGPADRAGVLVSDLVLAPNRTMIYTLASAAGHESLPAADGVIPREPTTDGLALSAARSTLRVSAGTLAPAGETVTLERFDGVDAYLPLARGVDAAGAPRPGPFPGGTELPLRTPGGGFAPLSAGDRVGLSLTNGAGNVSDIALLRDVPPAPSLTAARFTNLTGAVETGASPLLADASPTRLFLYLDDDGTPDPAGTARHRDRAAGDHSGGRATYPFDRRDGAPTAWEPAPAGKHLGIAAEYATGDESPIAFFGAVPGPPAGGNHAEGDLARLSLEHAPEGGMRLRDAAGLTLHGAEALLVSADDGATWYDLAATDGAGTLVRKAERLPLSACTTASRIRYAWRDGAGILSAASAVDGTVAACTGFGLGEEIPGPAVDAALPARFSAPVRAREDIASAAAFIRPRLAASSARAVIFGTGAPDIASAPAADILLLHVELDAPLDADETGWAFLAHPDANGIESAEGGHAPAPAENLAGDFHTVAWRLLGTPGGAAAGDIRLTIDAFSDLVVAYRDAAAGGRVTVTSWDGASWSALGAAGDASGDPAAGPALAADRYGGLFVATADAALGGRARVRAWDGLGWADVGTPGFSDGAAGALSLAADRYGMPFLAFRDGARGGRATVMTFDGETWQTVGPGGSTAGETPALALALDGADHPLVAYSDGADGGRLAVRRFDGTTWAPVGPARLTLGAAVSLALIVDTQDRPVVAGLDAGDGGRGFALRFEGGAWTPLGTGDPAPAGAGTLSFAFDAAGRPAAAFPDPAAGGRASARVLEGGAWIPLGAAGFGDAPLDAAPPLAADPFGAFHAALRDAAGRAAIYTYR